MKWRRLQDCMDIHVMDEAIVIVAYILIGGLFILTFFTYTSTSDLHRQKVFKWYVALAIAWVIVFYYLTHSNKYPSSWVDDYLSYSMGFGWALPSIIAQAFNQRRHGSAIIQLKRTKSNIIIMIMCIISMIWISFVYAPSYYENGSSSLISFFLCGILVTIAVFIMFLQKTAFYTGGISASGFLWAWSDFESYSWKDHKLSLQTRKSLHLRIAIPHEDKQIVEALLIKHIITDMSKS